MNSIDISAYMTSIRPYRWLHIHKMLAKSGLNFEIIIVGPSIPNFELPQEIKYYYSNVKPLQCCHAAVTISSGQTLLQIVDDVEYDDGGIKAMFDQVINNDRTMATCRYYYNNEDRTQYQNTLGLPTNYLPLLPVCGLYKRSTYFEVGGLDKRFNGIMGELDLYMRISVAGYITKFVNYKCVENTFYQKNDRTGLYNKYRNIDRPLLVKLWCKNNSFTTTRNDIVKSYEDKDILTVEQKDV